MPGLMTKTERLYLGYLEALGSALRAQVKQDFSFLLSAWRHVWVKGECVHMDGGLTCKI